MGHYVTPFPINFTSLAVPTVPFANVDNASLKVLAALLSSKYLHPEIREKGGAYGGGATAGGGTFTYYSYRDPKNLETFSVYRKSGEWALKNNFESLPKLGCTHNSWLQGIEILFVWDH